MAVKIEWKWEYSKWSREMEKEPIKKDNLVLLYFLTGYRVIKLCGDKYWTYFV